MTEVQQVAFGKLKSILIEDIILAYPDFSLPFILETGVNAVALGACLSQDQGGIIRPVAFVTLSCTYAWIPCNWMPAT